MAWYGSKIQWRHQPRRSTAKLGGNLKNRCFPIEFHGERYVVATTLREQGDELLLFLHGLGCSRGSFKDIWSRDEFKDYSIMTLDFIGFGDSSKSDTFSYEMEDQASICAEVLSNIDSQKIHIIAHSMGGAIGLLLPPDLLDSALTFSNLEGNLSPEDCGIVSRKTVTVSYDEFVKDVMPEFKNLSESLGKGRFFLDSSLPTAFYKSAESLVRWSDSGKLLSRFKNLSCRKAYFYGEDNTETTGLHRLDNIEKIMIPRGGHFMMNDNPDECYLRLREFLSSD